MAAYVPYSRTGCLLCDEIRDTHALSSLLSVYKNPRDKILIDSRRFMVIPDISPVVPGHTLLVTREHLPCFAGLPRESATEFDAIKREAISFVTEAFSRPFLFEHGSAFGQTGSGVCIYHAHIHVIPARLPVHNYMEEYGSCEQLRNIFAAIRANRESLLNYLCYEDQEGRGYLASSFFRSPPCQFIRRILADYFHVADWNWKSVFALHPAMGTDPGITSAGHSPH